MDSALPLMDYRVPRTALAQLLEWLEETIDLKHLARVEERHMQAMRWERLARPPVTFSAPVPPPFEIYPYSEAFRDPTKMLVNELIGPYAAVGPSPSIVNSVLIKDDYPLQIRAFYGIGLFVSLFGVESEVVDDNFPWVRPIGAEAVKRVVARGIPALEGGLFGQALDTMAYYREVLAPYPKCRQAIHITQPDLQGPFENAGHLWGGDVFAGIYECPDLLRELLDLLAETWIRACRKLAAASTEKARDDFIYLHFGLFEGGGLLKDDSCVMLSPKAYREFVRPINEKILATLGGGGIHWCGNGDQWRAEVLQTKNLLCLDFGQPYVVDLKRWADLLREHHIPIARMEWPLDRFETADPISLFPTGAGFTILLDDFRQARPVMEAIELGRPAS